LAKSISFSRLPGGNPIFQDYVKSFERVRHLYSVNYPDPPAQWSSVTHRQGTTEDRTDLVEGLLDDARRWNCTRQTRQHIEALRHPDTLAVVTGQQVGLFGGPLYTFYKATAAVLWAQALQALTGRLAVPVFWMETSDHDFHEVNHIRMLDPGGDEALLQLPHAPEEKRRIVGTITLNGEIEKLIQRLWALLPANTYRGPFLEQLRSFYHPGETLGDAFARFMAHLFGEDGLVLYDAENARCKKPLAPLWDRILASSPELNRLLTEATQQVHRSGYPPQIQPQNDRLQLFLRTGDVRVPVTLRGELLHDGRPPEKLGLEELRRRAERHPELFIPKVSLRPVVQDYLFPTAAYIAGPAEIAYLAQLLPLYRQLGVTPPAVIPRLSVTLIESKVRKVLDKYNFTPEQLRLGADPLIHQLLSADPSNDPVSLFAGARRKWEEINDELMGGMMAIDPTLEHTVEKTMERQRQGLDLLEVKAREAIQRKHETLVAQVRKACVNLMPGGQLQERRYSLPYYLARYGRSLSLKVRQQCQVDLYRHQLVYLEEGE